MNDTTRLLDEALAGSGPARATGHLHFGELPGGSRIEVPFTAFRGASPGRTVWIMAARDGDEVHATLIAMELQRRLDPASLAGTVVVMPVGNVPGFGVMSRVHPLAPSFLEEQMDDRFFDVLSERGGAFVDLHSAGVPSDTVDWTLFVEGDEVGAGMARAYGSPFRYEHRMGGGEGPDPGLLDGALFVRLANAGVSSILIEAGGGLPPSSETVDRGVAGVENVLRELGTMPGGATPTADGRLLSGFRIVTPSRGGLLEDPVGLGVEVEEGQVLGRVVDPFGDTIEEIRAPVPGVIVTIPVNPAIGTGTWAFEIAW